ncbi:hypothetical protein BX661DRAFT_226057 [Kickxella alabastrina]|uniref:uncharacterized protein n=1 Tax=Kickxella alabastrina TaxID=61397 RepID=UPI002220D058|nr:uncharacterized protein BX661DRAFT_226057 [Kickxella alabastrina]KAI7824033.1 hypothetical protein BX661DRAFT_226057 [Kickxella alabastrina]
MSNLYKQTAGAIKDAIKDAIGSMVGNNDLADKGRKQWAEGEGKQNMRETQTRREEKPLTCTALATLLTIMDAKDNAAYHNKLVKDNARSGF